MNYSNIIIGVLRRTGINMLINHIIMIFKQILFYNRDKSFTPTLSMFQIRLNQIERIENKIAVKNGKTYNHLCKWSKYLQIQNSQKKNPMYTAMLKPIDSVLQFMHNYVICLIIC